MSRGFYTIASGMLTQQRALNTISNNMANIKTPGFKTERVVTTTFEQELMVRMENGKLTPIGKGAPITMVEDVVTTFDATALSLTERPFDIAIQGEGFFTVQNDAGQNYLTRNGNFDVDENGLLVLPGIGRVQGENGDIEVNGSDFRVELDGTVIDSKGKVLDKILVQVPAEGVELSKYTNGMYMTDGELVQLEMPNVAQGVLEGSNVDPNSEIALMIQTQRSFQSCAKALTMIDEINQKSANLASL